MNQLIQTSECSIIYGTFNGKENEELFRCPRALDDTDLVRYIETNRCLVNPMGSSIPFVDDNTTNLRLVEEKELIGYWRMYFRNGNWYGRWFHESDKKPDEYEKQGISNIVEWICKNFTKGCDFYMTDYFKNNFKEWDKNRFLIKPYLNEYYKIMVDTTYGNGDYPVRIYVYR